MSFNRIGAVVISLTLACAMAGRAQQSETDEVSLAGEESSPSVWHLMRYAGVLRQEAGRPRPTVAGVTFALYEEKEGGAPLWMETQNVQVDSQGHYAALLGDTKTDGVPAELFASGKARWLGIQVAGQFVEERVPLGSVPYAVQAGDARMLGGKSAVDYALTAQIQRQVTEEVGRLLRAAGLDVSAGDSAGGGFQKQETLGPPEYPASNANPHAVTPVTLRDLDDKLNTILATLGEPEPIFSFVFCTEPALQFAASAGVESELQGKGEGRLGAEAYGNGLFARINAEAKGKVGGGLAFGWDILKFGFCFDLGAAVRNASSTSSSGSATALRQASLTTNDGITLNSTFLDKIAELNEPANQEAMLAQMLGLADSLGVDPQNLQTALGTVANLSFNNAGGPFAALQLPDEDRQALMATLPIPAGVKPVLTDPAGFLGSQVQSLVTQLTQPQGICNISPPPGLELLVNHVCTQPGEPFGPLLLGLQATTNTIKTTVNSVKTTVEGLPTAGEVKDAICAASAICF